MPRLLRSLIPFSIALIATAALSAQTKERFTAAAVNMNVGAAGTIDIVVDRYSTDAERDRLMKVMMDKGPEKLLDTLQDLPRVGYFRSPNSLGWDIHFARKVRGAEGDERIVLVTDRRIDFWEAANRPRSIDYPFTVIELHLKADGTGEGKLSLATRIMPDKDKHQIVLENYGTQPVLLTTVKREPVTR
jgi:hypothetical protein